MTALHLRKVTLFFTPTLASLLAVPRDNGSIYIISANESKILAPFSFLWFVDCKSSHNIRIVNMLICKISIHVAFVQMHFPIEMGTLRYHQVFLFLFFFFLQHPSRIHVWGGAPHFTYKKDHDDLQHLSFIHNEWLVWWANALAQ